MKVILNWLEFQILLEKTISDMYPWLEGKKMSFASDDYNGGFHSQSFPDFLILEDKH